VAAPHLLQKSSGCGTLRLLVEGSGMVKNLAIFVLGATVVMLVAAVGALLGWRQLEAVAPERLVYATASSKFGEEPICRGSVLDIARPKGIVITPAQAEMIFRSTFPDQRLIRTGVHITDQGDVWRVEQTPPKGWKGEGYIVHISKCDATITLLQLAQ
jgi:hypothetical protein